MRLLGWMVRISNRVLVFFLPPQWKGYVAFAKKVSSVLFGGPASCQSYVAIRAVPMGWANSVDVIQNFIRRFVFKQHFR